MAGQFLAARIAALVIGIVLIAGAAPASASVGQLTQKPGTQGCIYQAPPPAQCAAGNGVADTDAAVSPDGKNLYTVSFNYDGNQARSTLAVLDRDPVTGVVTQKAGSAGCFRDPGVPANGCQAIDRLFKPTGVAVSPDGKSVYVTDYHTQTLRLFDRDLTTGELTPGACYDASTDGIDAPCVDTRAMGRPDRLVVSPNNLNVYVAGSDFGNSVVVFDRDPVTGELEQKPGADGCIHNTGASGCVDGRLLSHPEGIAISPDGRSVYASGRDADGIVIFDRDLGTGVLTQKAGTDGCISQPATDGCGLGRATVQDGSGASMKSPVVSADNKNVYLPANGSNAVVIFDRDTSGGPTHGDLTQKAGTAGCISEDGTDGLGSRSASGRPRAVRCLRLGREPSMARASTSAPARASLPSSATRPPAL